MTEPLPAFFYGRVSKLADDKEGSIPTQIRRAGQLAELRGYRIVAEFVDPDTPASSKKIRRPQYDTMMHRLDEIRGGAVIFYRLDRFCRRVGQFVEAWEQCEDHDVALLSATEPIDTSTPIGVAMMQVLMVFAELEIRTLQARLKDHHATIAVAGRYQGGPAPFGWAYDPATKQVSIDEKQADVVRAMCRAVLAGWSAQRIADAVNDGALLGVPAPPRPGRWDHSTVTGILRSRRLVGDRTHRGVVVAAGAFPAIVDERTWDAVQAAMRTRRPGRPRAPLSGIARCGACDGPMFARVVGGSYATYGCATAGCGRVSIMRHRLEGEVAGRLFAYLDDPGLAQRLDRARNRIPKRPRTRRRAQIEQQLERAERLAVEGLIAEARFRVIRAELLGELDALTDDSMAMPVPTMNGLARARRAWIELTDEEQRQIYSWWIDTVTIPAKDGRRAHDLSAIQVQWRF